VEQEALRPPATRGHSVRVRRLPTLILLGAESTSAAAGN
jgi:hypothetical protein